MAYGDAANDLNLPGVRRYGDFGVGGVLPKCVERLFWGAIEGGDEAVRPIAIGRTGVAQRRSSDTMAGAAA